MSKGNSTERARMMKALGAEVVLVDQMPDSIKGQVSGADLALVEEVARKITIERGAFRADQFNLISTVHAHEFYTAEEMWEQCDGNIDAFVVEGRIEWDDRYDDRTPKFIIDGQEYSLEEIGRMMMSCEGWNFIVEIIEPTE